MFAICAVKFLVCPATLRSSELKNAIANGKGIVNKFFMMLWHDIPSQWTNFVSKSAHLGHQVTETTHLSQGRTEPWGDPWIHAWCLRSQRWQPGGRGRPLISNDLIGLLSYICSAAEAMWIISTSEMQCFSRGIWRTQCTPGHRRTPGRQRWRSRRH